MSCLLSVTEWALSITEPSREALRAVVTMLTCWCLQSTLTDAYETLTVSYRVHELWSTRLPQPSLWPFVHDLVAYVLGESIRVQLLAPVMNSKPFVIVFLPKKQKDFGALVLEVQFTSSRAVFGESLNGEFCECFVVCNILNELNQESTCLSTLYSPPLSIRANIH